MKKYFYQNAMSKKHYINGDRKAPQWLNQDLPDIFRVEDSTRVIEVTFPNYQIYIYADDKEEAEKLQKFVFSTTGKYAESYY